MKFHRPNYIKNQT